jgi:hypothetical protein
MALEKELETYARELPNLMASVGKYVLISESEVSGVFGAYEDAIGAGYQKFGLKPFMVKQIQAVEQVQYFTRPISPCHTELYKFPLGPGSGYFNWGERCALGGAEIGLSGAQSRSCSWLN